MVLRIMNVDFDFYLESSYSRKLLHQLIDDIRATILVSEDGNLRLAGESEFVLKSDSGSDISDSLAKELEITYDETAKVSEFEGLISELHKKISEKDVDFFLDYEGKFTNIYFKRGEVNEKI